MKLSKKQTAALDLLEDKTTKELLYGGAAGGGKTRLGCYWQLKQRLKYPGSRGLIGRDELMTLKGTTLKTLFDIAEIQGLKRGKHLDLTSSQDKENPNCIEFYNGSLIFLRELCLYPSDVEFDRLGSLEITDAYIDECSQVSDKARRVLRFRLRHKLTEYGLVPKILYTSNPVKGWLYDEFYMPWSKKEPLENGYVYLPAYIWDNPWAPVEYVQMLKDLPDGPEKQRLYYGNWDYADDSASLCDYDSVCDMFTNDFILPTGEKSISADLAMQGRDRFVAGSWDGMVCKIRVDKLKSTGKEIEQDLKRVMIEDSVPHSKTVVDSDGLGNYLESYLKGIKEFHGGTPAINKKEFANLKSECAYKLAEMVVKRQIKIICSDFQRDKIIQEMAFLKRKDPDADETRKRIISKDKMKEGLRRSPDYLDMLLMKMIFHVKPQFVSAATSLND